MKKTMKKILCTVLVVVLCLTSVPLQGFVDFDWDWFDFSMRTSAVDEYTEGYYTYIVENGEATITDVNNKISGDVIIPSRLGGYPVTTIKAFSNCNKISSIIIPASVMKIEDDFSSCNNLLSINVDDNNISYSSDEFGVLFNKDKTVLIEYPHGNPRTTYNIPNSVISIGDFAFYYRAKLTTITIPKGVKSIGYKAFAGCEGLKNVIIPDSVMEIGTNAFMNCNNLTSITLGENINSIDAHTFDGCISLINITIDENNPNYSIDENAIALYNKNKTHLIRYLHSNTQKNYIIPNGVKSIGDSAFSGCDYLSTVVIPNSVTYMGNDIFYSCDSLSNISLPNNLTDINYSMFSYCDRLCSVAIPKSIKNIYKYAFSCENLRDVYFEGTEEEWEKIYIDLYNKGLTSATIHYNYKFPQTSYFMVSSDQYSVDSINSKENATYKIHLLDQNSNFLPIDNVTVQNNTEYIVDVSTKKTSDTELELTVKPLSNGDASISLFNGDNSNPQYFNFTVYSNTTTYRADQVPVTNEKLKTNFSRGDLTVDNFEYKFDENKGKYIATMDVYNSSGAIGVVAAYTQDGLISEIEQVDPYIPLPSDFGEFLVYLGTGAVGILKGENWNYRFAGDSQKTPITIEVPEDGYLTVSCDISADEAVLIYNTVSIGVKTAFKTAEIIDYLGTDTDKLAKEASKTIVRKTSEYFKSKKGKDWVGKALSKISKKMSKQFSVAYLEDMSMLSFDMLEEICQNIGTDFSTLFFEVIDELIQEEIKSFGVMSVSKKLIKDKVIGVAERNLMKVASAIFEGGEYINFANELLGTYLYNTGTGKTMVVFKPKGEDGFICKDTIKVTSDVITDEVLLHTYIIKDTQKEDAFVRKTIYSDFNRGDGLRKEELSIDLNRIVEIHEISLWKNGQEVFDTFTATVEMNLPSYIDRRTCSIYRVEKDGTYTKLDTKIEGNKIIFETNHFSEYILTGVIEDLQETTPCDVHVYDEVRVEPSCTEAGSIIYTCYCGDRYTETIEPTGHNFDGSKCSNCDFDKADDCSCNCHKNGIAGFFFKLILFFQKIFRTNKTCSCGVAHY